MAAYMQRMITKTYHDLHLCVPTKRLYEIYRRVTEQTIPTLLQSHILLQEKERERKEIAQNQIPCRLTKNSPVFLLRKAPVQKNLNN